MKKKGSVFGSVLCSVLVLALLGGGFLGYQKFKLYKDNTDKEISSLQEQIASLKKKNIKKDQVKIQTKQKEEKIPKDAIVVELPKVPKVTAKVPKVVTVGGTKITHEEDKQLSMDMPVEKEEKPKEVDTNSSKKEDTNIKIVGLTEFGRVSTYLRTDLISSDEVKNNLEDAGFKVIGSQKLEDGLESIAFTNDTLKEFANISPYLANLRVLIDKKHKQISIQNPYYFAKAFLQDKFDDDKAKEVLISINKAFKNLKTSDEKLKYTLLESYQFMFGMPYYKDMIEIAKGKSTLSLLSKIPKNSIVFSQKISEHRYILGVKLSNKSQKFIDIIGTQNANLLPYPLLIENGVAKTLNPKYYIAISYPMLKMSQFMKISSVPDEIESDLQGLFR